MSANGEVVPDEGAKPEWKVRGGPVDRNIVAGQVMLAQGTPQEANCAML